MNDVGFERMRARNTAALLATAAKNRARFDLAASCPAPFTYGARTFTKILQITLIAGFMSESRAVPRHRILKAGAIEFSGGGSISCAVKNLSASGAALEVVSALDIPDRLTLYIPTEHFKRSCHVVWRKEKRIGVAFD